MSTFAVIQTGGKQYLVSKGHKLQIEKLAGEAGESVKFHEVLFTGDEKSYSLGKPFISSSVVEGKILKQGRGKKIHVLKYKAKSKYRRKIGHRQHFTEIEIIKI